MACGIYSPPPPLPPPRLFPLPFHPPPPPHPPPELPVSCDAPCAPLRCGRHLLGHVHAPGGKKIRTDETPEQTTGNHLKEKNKELKSDTNGHATSLRLQGSTEPSKRGCWEANWSCTCLHRAMTLLPPIPVRSLPVKQTGLSESFTNDSVFSCLHILKFKKYEATERKPTGAGLYRASVSLIFVTEMDPC